ncbi:MAG TPA: secretin N-terminal domain-containing protein, partial [bacterium]|nr:secretin N-terminal domain-containing protein [bacterium]
MKTLFLKIIVLYIFILSLNCIASQKIESLTFNQTKLSLVLEILSKKTGMKLISDTDISDKSITAYLENISPEQAIESILAANGLYREKLPDSDIYIVYSEQRKISSQKPVSACFQLKHAFASDIATELKNIGFEKSIAVDNRTNVLVIKDTPANIEIVKAIIENLDIEHKNLPVKTTV